MKLSGDLFRCCSVLPYQPLKVMKLRELLLRRGALGSATGQLTESEDDELSRLHRRESDVDVQATAVALFWRIDFGVTLDEERLPAGQAEQHALSPAAAQERADIAPHHRPQRWRVGLEDHPLGALLD